MSDISCNYNESESHVSHHCQVVSGSRERTMNDLALLSLLSHLAKLHDIAFGEVVNGQETMMLALEKLYSVHSFSVGEIRRLRAKTNRLIRVHNEQDANGNHIGEHYAATEDLVLEDEI